MDIRRLAHVLRLRLRSLLRRNAVEHELAEEMRFHLEERARELVERGMSPTDAHDAALRAFGGVEQRKEECLATPEVWSSSRTSCKTPVTRCG